MLVGPEGSKSDAAAQEQHRHLGTMRGVSLERACAGGAHALLGAEQQHRCSRDRTCELRLQVGSVPYATNATGRCYALHGAVVLGAHR